MGIFKKAPEGKTDKTNGFSPFGLSFCLGRIYDCRQKLLNKAGEVEPMSSN